LLAGRGFAYEVFNQRNVTGFAESLRHCLTIFCYVSNGFGVAGIAAVLVLPFVYLATVF